MHVCLEDVQSDFERFWVEVGAKGDLQAALAEWDTRHNASDASSKRLRSQTPIGKVFDKLKRMVRKFPQFVRDA